MKIIFFLPNQPFNHKHFMRVYEHTKRLFVNSDIMLVSLDFTYEFYKKELKDHKIISLKTKNNSLYLTGSSIKEFGFDIDKIVIMSDINDENPPISWEPSLMKNIDFFRDRQLGYYGLRQISEDGIIDFEAKHSDKHIFNKLAMHKSEESLFTYFPYGYILKESYLYDTNSLSFRVAEDLSYLKNRDNDHKLIVLFGGSSCYDICSLSQEMFSSKLQDKLNINTQNNVTVLNFAQRGHLVINEMITYILFAHQYRPDIVIAHDGYNDLFWGQSSDTALHKDYAINYNVLLEAWGKKIHNAYDIKVQTEKQQLNFDTPLPLVLNTYIDRKVQFQEIVEEHGAKFISAFQPTIYSKASRHHKEEDIEPIFKHLKIAKNMKYIYKEYNNFIQQNTPFKYHINFDSKFKIFTSEDYIFIDECHQLPEVNEFIANEYYLLIKELF